jgi:hypothetical protein
MYENIISLFKFLDATGYVVQCSRTFVFFIQDRRVMIRILVANLRFGNNEVVNVTGNLNGGIRMEPISFHRNLRLWVFPA